MRARSDPRTAPAGEARKRPKLSAVGNAAAGTEDSQFDRLVYERVRLGIERPGGARRITFRS